MYSRKGQSTTELWAVRNKNREILWSRGGSSTAPKLMVYATREAAERALKSPWIKQIISNRDDVEICCIYSVSTEEPNDDK